MSFRNKQPVPPARHRSSSATRNGSSNSLAYARPRSMGLYSSNSSPYTSYTSPSNTYTSAYNNYNSPYGGAYSSSYKSPYFQNDYRNNSTFGSLTIPAKALSNVNLYGSGHRSRQMSRQGSYSRDRSLSKSRSNSVGSGMGSRSISLNSLNSEGYIVRIL